MIKLNGVSQPISIEYKMVHGLNQVVFRDSALFIEVLEIFTKKFCKKFLAPYATHAKKVCAPYVKKIHLPQWQSIVI